MFKLNIKSSLCILVFIFINLNDFTNSLNEMKNSAPQFQVRPQWVPTCSRKNPNKDNCFKKFFEGMFPFLARGIPEIGVEPFEPLRIDSVTVSRGDANLQLIGGFRNLVVHGPSNATVKRASLDLVKNLLEFDLIIPKLRIESIYNLKGNILLLPLVGNGDVTMTLKDVRTSVKTNITVQNLPEVRHKYPAQEVIKIESMKVTFLVGNMRIHLDNLFNGNKVLGQSINLFLNQNSNDVISELRPDLESGLESIFTSIWNNVFTKIPTKYWLV